MVDIPQLTFTEKESLAAVALDEQWAALSAEYPDAVRPTPEFVRFVTIDEWPDATAACLTKAGILAESVGGGISRHAVEGEEQEYDLASFACTAQFPVDPLFAIPLNDYQARLLYDYYVDTLTPCLEAAGYEPTRPPRFEDFVDTVGTHASWSPYDGLERVVTGWNALNLTCPQEPANLYG